MIKYRKWEVERLRSSKVAGQESVEVPGYNRIEHDVNGQHDQSMRHCEVVVYAANFIHV